MKQRRRKAHVVRRQDMDRLMRQVVRRSILRTMQSQIDKVTFQVVRRDAESRAQMLSLIAAGFEKTAKEVAAAMAGITEAAKHFPKTYLQSGTNGA